MLLVEDNKANPLLAKTWLSNDGYQVDIAGNGIEALDCVVGMPYDIIVMDVQMPEMDGFEATRLIRALPDERATLPIIAMTANALPEDRSRCLLAGMNDYVSKPIDKAVLLAKMAFWMGEGAGPRKTAAGEAAPPISRFRHAAP